jgi:hypothetical protein
MQKKTTIICMAVAAFAALAAPTASAVQLKENGTTIAVGASITGKSSGETKFTAAGLTLTCSSTHARGTVTRDASGTIAGEIPVGGIALTGTGAGEDCTSNLGSFQPVMTSKLCLHIANGADTGTMTGCGGPIKFSLNITGVTTCKYQTASASGTIATAPNDAEVTASEQPIAEEAPNQFFCPDSAKIDTQWVLTTTDGTTLQFTT